MRFETLAVHAGLPREGATGAAGAADVAPSIHLSTTFARDENLELLAGYAYIREDNPNQRSLEEAVAALEGGAAAVLFGSGQAAGAALLQGLPPASRVVFCRDLYHGFRTLATEHLVAWGHSFTTVDPRDLDEVARALRTPSQLLWLESPSNPLLEVCDLQALAASAHAAGARTVVDNTFATPALQRPLALGADVVLHSATKYFGGHSDVQGGLLVFAQAGALPASAVDLRHTLGAVCSPFNAWLIQRGLRTLPCRMAVHSANAQRIAEAMVAHPAIWKVHYPGLPGDPGHAIASRQMSGFSGMLSLRVRGGEEAARRVVSRVRIFTRATSLGGVESLIEHRRSAEGEHSTAPEDLVRISVGLENAEDLIKDLEQALAPGYESMSAATTARSSGNRSKPDG
jgi:cystathionine gamma-synthase